MNIAIHHYRTLHTMPEVSGQEYKTARYLENQLRCAGFSPVRWGETGLSADILVDPELPWVVIRADMDALPVVEDSGLPFCSKNPGAMHACGHDAHCAMALTAALELKGQNLPQNVRFLFQSAEETTMGAAEMIELGALPENTVAVFACHVWPGLEEGVVAAAAGPMMASGDVFRAIFSGESVHCAVRPAEGDTLRAAVGLAADLPRIEALANGDGSLVFCGSIHSGTSHNIVPDSAMVYGTIRSFCEDSRLKLCKAVEESAAALAEKNRVSLQFGWEGGCPQIKNDPALIGRLKEVLPGFQPFVKPSLTGEDFALFQRKAPGVMLWLGNGESRALHNPGFRVSEAILEKGVSTWKTIANTKW